MKDHEKESFVLEQVVKERKKRKKMEIHQTDPDPQTRDRAHCHSPLREGKNNQVAQWRM